MDFYQFILRVITMHILYCHANFNVLTTTTKQKPQTSSNIAIKQQSVECVVKHCNTGNNAIIPQQLFEQHNIDDRHVLYSFILFWPVCHNVLSAKQPFATLHGADSILPFFVPTGCKNCKSNLSRFQRKHYIL